MLSLLVGQYTPSLVRLVLPIFLSQRGSKFYEKLVEPLKKIKITGRLALPSFYKYLPKIQEIYKFLNFLVIRFIATLAWLIPRLFRQFVRMYAIDLIRNFYRFSKVTGDLSFFS